MAHCSRKILVLCALASLLVSCGPTPSPTVVPVPTGASTALTGTSAPAAVTTAPVRPTSPATAAPTVAAAPPVLASAVFAPYRKEAVNVRPAVSHEAIAPDLSNVVSAFLLSPQQRAHLAQNGFVVSPSEEKEFYTLYEKARYNNEPVFVSSDSLLHVYHLLFDKVLRTLERERFIPILKQLNALMLAGVQEQYEELRGTALEESARRNVAFFAVASRLLGPTVEIPAYATDLAEAELALIEAHAGIMSSPLFPGLPLGEDYTQYIPRGHYTRGEDLKAYFRAMMWYGRMTFRLIGPVDPRGREETRRALLIVQALAADAEAASLWQAIYEPTVFFVGRSDDLLCSEYVEVMARVYGGIPGDPSAFADEEKLTAFMREASELRPPRILGIVIFSSKFVGRSDRDAYVEETTKGFRFMGQRFIPDSYIFGQLVHEYIWGRELPKALDILAVLGSERAYAILDQEGETGYYNYPESIARLREEFAALPEEEWTQNLYWSWLYLFFPLLEAPGEGYPQFMRGPAWLDKSLNTVLGSWAELRHDTILYAKQSYSMAEGGWKAPPEPTPPKGYVEPVPEFYARLAALAAMTRGGLKERGLLNALDEGSLRSLEDLALALKGMAEKELAGQPLTEAEYGRLRYYGMELEELTFAASDAYEGAGGTPITSEEIQSAVIADVHTSPNCGAVLEVGVGRIFVLYAIVPVEGELVIAKGGAFSYYEFPWPMDDRLTDEAWWEMLDAGQAPPLPQWTASYRVDETEEEALRQGIWHFVRQWIAAAYQPDPSLLQGAAAGEALAERQAYVQALADQDVYEGYHLVRLEFLSFDLQDADHAVVTARQTWWDERYRDSPKGSGAQELIARRPEYTVGVIYHLEKVDGTWVVSRVLIEGEVPAWQEE